MIKNSILKLAENYGEPIDEYMGKSYYAFPRKEILANVEPLELRELCRVGFRDERIVAASQMMMDPSFLTGLLWRWTRPALKREKLMSLPGVGPKVSCILLFAFGRHSGLSS